MFLEACTKVVHTWCKRGCRARWRLFVALFEPFQFDKCVSVVSRFCVAYHKKRFWCELMRFCRKFDVRSEEEVWV